MIVGMNIDKGRDLCNSPGDLKFASHHLSKAVSLSRLSAFSN
jgi:hypothetical protein